MDQIGKRITDDLWVLSAMHRWYNEQVQLLCTWLTERLDRSLHPYQCTCLAHIVKVGISSRTLTYVVADNQLLCFQKIYAEFELQGVEEDKLNTQHWNSIEQRMQTEEAACVLTGADTGENG